jgi:hypothetical protein
MTVRAEKGDAVAGLCPCGDESARQPHCAIRELRISESLSAANDSDLVRKLLTRVAQKTDGSEWNVHLRLLTDDVESIRRQEFANVILKLDC